MRRPVAVLASALFGLALGALLLLIFLNPWGRRPDVPVSPPIEVVPDSEVVRDRPGERPPRLIERIVRVPVPVVRRESEGTPDTALARKYADAQRRAVRWKAERDSLVREARARGDTATADSVSRETPPRGILPPVAGSYDGKRLRLWLTESNGRVMEATAQVRPHFRFRSGLDSLTDTLPLVTQDRAWVRLAREVAECAPEGGALGAAAGALSGSDDRLLRAGIGAGLGVLICVLGD